SRRVRTPRETTFRKRTRRRAVRVPARPGPDLERNATMSAAAVNLLRVVLGSIGTATLKGVVTFVLASVAGSGFYSAMVSDSASNSVSVEAVTIPPLVRAEPL